MKKLISSILFAMVLISCLNLTVFAGPSNVISDDLQTLTYEGNAYSRVNASMLEAYYFAPASGEIQLSEKQKEEISDISLETMNDETIVVATIQYHDGSSLTIGFLQNDYLDTYNKVIFHQKVRYTIDFGWPDGNIVTTTMEDCLGNALTITENDLDRCDFFNVTVRSNDDLISVITGALILYDDNFYYADFEELNISNRREFYPADYPALTMYEIVDAELLTKLQEAENAYYEDDFGFLYDDDLNNIISSVFIIAIFAVLPLVLFVVFLILAIRSKATYRKLFTTISILSMAELIVFTILAVTIFVR